MEQVREEMKKISFIMPCYGSEKIVRNVVEEICVKVTEKKEEYEYEIVMVNDCSPDNVWDVIKDLAESNQHIKGINLSKNANRPGAVMAGLTYCVGDFVVIMDDDGQCPMNKLWELIEPLKSNNYDVSMAKYPTRKQSLFKNFGTFMNKKMSQFIINRPKDVEFTNFIAMKRYVVDEILKYKSPYPYITGLLLRTTKYFYNVEMEERKRFEGKSTFTLKKMLSMWLNGFTAFSIKPLRLATTVGIISATIGFIFGIYLIIRRLIVPNIVVGYSSILAAILFIGGLIMLMLGIIGEYVGRIYICINKSPQYVIKNIINLNEEKNVHE